MGVVLHLVHVTLTLVSSSCSIIGRRVYRRRCNQQNGALVRFEPPITYDSFQKLCCTITIRTTAIAVKFPFFLYTLSMAPGGGYSIKTYKVPLACSLLFTPFRRQLEIHQWTFWLSCPVWNSDYCQCRLTDMSGRSPTWILLHYAH